MGAEFRHMICGMVGQLWTPEVSKVCPFPSIETCWPAYIVASLLLTLETVEIMNATMEAVDIVMGRSAFDWSLALKERWPIFGLLLRLTGRVSGLPGFRCRPSGVSMAGDHGELTRAFGPLRQELLANGGFATEAKLAAFARAACPHLEQCDRRACAPWVGGSAGRIRVFQSREVISDRIRGTGQPSCGQGVSAEVELAKEAAARRGMLPWVVEVGPFICDCLWIHAPEVRRWEAYEINSAAVALCQETIDANGLREKALVSTAALGDGRLVRTLINGDEPSWILSVPKEANHDRETPGVLWIPTVRLDDLIAVPEGEFIDLLVIHTNGFEKTILEGAHRLLSTGLVRAVVAPLIGMEDWRSALPANFSTGETSSSGVGFLRFHAASARWVGPE